MSRPYLSILHPLLFLSTTVVIVYATSSPPSPPTLPATSTSALDPNQLRALQSLNFPTTKNPCTNTSTTTTCDSSTPYRQLVSLTLTNCSNDVVLTLTALESLSTLTSLNFINCPIPIIHFPSQLTSNLHTFTSINSLKKLTGVWLSRFDNLTELTVSKTSITASGPSIILNNMNFINSVTLSYTNLSGYLPNNWHPNLTFVDLSGNKLKGQIPISLTRLENLVHLNLSSNSITETIPTTIGDLISLKNLSLSSNSLSGPIPESLAAIPGLMNLDLGSNRLNGTIPDFLRDMKTLKYLNLEGNNFHGVLPFNASFIKGLEVFKVGENSNLCYNHSTLVTKVKLGIAPCDKHGLPMSPPPAKDSSSDDYSDGSDYEGDGNSVDDSKNDHHGPNKIVLGVAIALSSIVFLIVFSVLLSRCCR